MFADSEIFESMLEDIIDKQHISAKSGSYDEDGWIDLGNGNRMRGKLNSDQS